MKAIDFSTIPVELRIDEPEPVDMRRSLGNTINRNTADIGLSDFARKIYYSEVPVEIPEEYVQPIIAIVTHVDNLLAPAKKAVIRLINEAAQATPEKAVIPNEVKPIKRKRK